MRDAGSRFAQPAQTIGKGGLRFGRFAARLGVLVALVTAFVALTASPAAAQYGHPTVNAEFGREGPPASGLGSFGCMLAYQSATHRLYVYSEGEIFALDRTAPGIVAPVAGSFPAQVPFGFSCGDPAMAVDNSTGPSQGDIYAGSSGQAVYGYGPTGAALGSPWPLTTPEPIEIGSQVCGVATSSNGEIWLGLYGHPRVEKFNTNGEPTGSIPVLEPEEFCKIAVDPSTSDLYVAPYGGSTPLIEYTAASGYTKKVRFPVLGNGNPGLAINGAKHRLYVANGTPQLKVYDTNTTALLETVNVGGNAVGVAVDEPTDTIFVTDATNHVIKELRGLHFAPTATTGEPTGDAQAAGTADPDGAGNITECFFKYGTTTSYGSTEPCTAPLPITSGPVAVHADLPGLSVEQTYHYRLVLSNGLPGGTSEGQDETITPHHVKFLKTDPATELTATTATINGSFEGTNEATTYHFDWGRTSAYGHQTPDEGVGPTVVPTPINAPLTGLDEGVVYHYRVVAENAVGTSVAKDRTFVAPKTPSIESFSSKNVTANSADITAKINPNGFETEYHVEYGASSNYGSVEPVPDATLAAGNNSENVVVPLTGLNGSTYHFRIVATSAAGTSTTEDQTFTFFPPSDCPNTNLRQQTGSQYLPDCRAYELVSPGETGNVVLQTVGGRLTATHATDPARFGFFGKWGAIAGYDTPNNSLDPYIATRTNQGWVTSYAGLHGSQVPNASSAFGSLNLETLIDFNSGFTCCRGRAFAWAVNGQSLGQWPPNNPAIPEADLTHGAYQPSPDFSHFFFTSENVDFDPEGHGLTATPGSAYDYNVETGTVTLISFDEHGDPITGGEPLRFPPSTGTQPNANFPGVSTDGSHVLMGVGTPPRLYMRVDDTHTYEVSKEKNVNYIGMTTDGSNVFFTSSEELTGDDHDTSADLYMWSESTNALTLLSAGPGGTGNLDACSATWTTKCNVVSVEPAIEGVEQTGNTLATTSGDIYFYSPEELVDGATPGGRNLYFSHDGEIKFVTTFESTRGIVNMQVSPNGDHAAFTTKSRLTAYDNSGLLEMYTYDPATGEVRCVSCNPDGDPPTVNLRASTNGSFMSDDGRTFWTTAEALVPQDTNELKDVYEFTGGRPQLITAGTGATDSRQGEDGSSGLVGVSSDGVNVYFATYDTLVAQDHNGPFFKYYDARSSGGFPAPRPGTPCVAADECHGAGSLPSPPAAIASGGDLGKGDNVAAGHDKHSHHKKHHHRKRAHRGKRHQDQGKGFNR